MFDGGPNNVLKVNYPLSRISYKTCRQVPDLKIEYVERRS
jgi:hypothetical protein